MRRADSMDREVTVTQGARHEKWLVGETRITIPRHREINELTVRSILKHLEAEFGKEWWR